MGQIWLTGQGLRITELNSSMQSIKIKVKNVCRYEEIIQDRTKAHCRGNCIIFMILYWVMDVCHKCLTAIQWFAAIGII